LRPPPRAGAPAANPDALYTTTPPHTHTRHRVCVCKTFSAQLYKHRRGLCRRAGGGAMCGRRGEAPARPRRRGAPGGKGRSLG
jgi:hypothetical protein